MCGVYMMKLTFLGAAQTVTGSRTLLEYHNHKYLIDCGLYQGPKEVRNLNWEPIPYSKEIDYLVLTHAHIDHSGLIPKFIVDGFQGSIIASNATVELCKIMLPDSGYLQEEDAIFANKTGHSIHKPALPLYTQKDAVKALSYFSPRENNKWWELDKSTHIRLLRAGHILGSTIVQFSLNHDSGPNLITFSGDLGNSRSFLLKDPETVTETDYLVLESTYGDRVQPKIDPFEFFAETINKVIKRGGTLVIPAFAVGRTQELLYIIDRLEKENKIPVIPVYLDSPMAEKATGIYSNLEAELKLNDTPNESFNFRTHNFKMIKSADDSMMLCMDDEPKIVISAAGMLTGGRVLHHLKSRLPHSKNAVLFVGYQAQGTKGLLLKNGLRSIRIHHQNIDVEAEILSLDTLSAHADSDDLLRWVKSFTRLPKKIFLNHGEFNGLQALKYRLLHETSVEEVIIPSHGESFKL
jgi:metallo-beta-lactamase family protein